MNQKLAPDCSRGSSRKQSSRFLMLKFRGSVFCRILGFCVLHFICASCKDIVNKKHTSLYTMECICNIFYTSCGEHKVVMILLCFW